MWTVNRFTSLKHCLAPKNATFFWGGQHCYGHSAALCVCKGDIYCCRISLGALRHRCVISKTLQQQLLHAHTCLFLSSSFAYFLMHLMQIWRGATLVCVLRATKGHMPHCGNKGNHCCRQTAPQSTLCPVRAKLGPSLARSNSPPWVC